MSQPFDLRKFLVDVFAPEPGERVAVIVDTPTENVPDNPELESRRAMAMEWRAGLESLGREVGFEVMPLVSYPAAGTHGGDFPAEAEVAGRQASTASILEQVSLALVLTVIEKDINVSL